MAEGEDRTHAPSERRRLRAREEGQAPLSRELVTAAGLAAVVLMSALGMTTMARSVAFSLRDMLADLGVSPGAALQNSGMIVIGVVGPIMIMLIVVGGAAALLQTGFLLNLGALAPDPGRIDPRRGLKRLFGMDNLVEAMKAILKLGVLGWALWSALSSFSEVLPGAVIWTPESLLDRIGRGFIKVTMMVLAAQVIIAVLDTGWMRWRFTQRLRMSREDLRQETKESDGDPRVKARLRQLRQARARKRMLADVARATVVITNPTHYAVALLYERGSSAAPRVVAKGMDEVAARIRVAAARAGVPLVANPPLARALHGLPLDAEVPAEHFKVVAEVIAYVWRLRGLAASDRRAGM